MKEKFTLDVPRVSDAGLENWRKFLTDDAAKNGGTAQTLLILTPDDRPVKLLCCSQTSIVYFLTDIEFEIEKSTFFDV